MNANIAPATHGEAYSEVLGSGDATIPNQRFKLAKPPLTYVSAPTPTGRASTLEIRVDGVAWHEVPTLYDAGPDDRVYEVRHEDSGATWVTFGDGLRGRRLPTSSVAEYSRPSMTSSRITPISAPTWMNSSLAESGMSPPLVSVTASGSGYARDGRQVQRTCTAKVEAIYGEFVV